MNSEIFATVTNNLDALLICCKDIAAAYRRESDGSAVGENADLQSIGILARNTQAKLDKVFQSEMYHLLGMGQMTPGQTTLFLRKIKDLGAYRPIVKTLATVTAAGGLPGLGSTLPKIKEGSYQSMLAETTLRSGGIFLPDGKPSPRIL